MTGALTTLGSAIPAGYNIAVINAPAEYMKEWINLIIQKRYNDFLSNDALEILWAFTVSIFLVGGAVGSLGGSWLANKYGRYDCSPC
jgi:SP family facilitated glucose transporter-like MFS transporter 3